MKTGYSAALVLLLVALVVTRATQSSAKITSGPHGYAEVDETTDQLSPLLKNMAETRSTETTAGTITTVTFTRDVFQDTPQTPTTTTPEAQTTTTPEAQTTTTDTTTAQLQFDLPAVDLKQNDFFQQEQTPPPFTITADALSSQPDDDFEATLWKTDLDMLPESDVESDMWSRFPHHHVHPHSGLCPFWSTILHGDYVASGVGMRNRYDGYICISGIPVCTDIKRAFLFWIILSYNCTPWSAAHIHFNGHPIRGTLIGVSGDPCWWTDRSYVFAADVTPWVTGNGHYHLSGFPVSYDAPLSEGASLVVVYNRRDLPLKSVTIYAGAATLNEHLPTVIWTFLHIPPICPKCRDDPKTTYIVGDGQPCWTDMAIFDSVGFLGAFEMRDGPYMDTLTIPVKHWVYPGETVVRTGIARGEDCLVWAAQVFSAPFCGRAPPPPCGCCARVEEYIDQIAFVAQERLHSGCQHICDIYESPPAQCWDAAITNICSCDTLKPVPMCSPIKTNYMFQVQAAKEQFMQLCDSKIDLIVSRAEWYKDILPHTCTTDQSKDIIRQYGDEVDKIIRSVPLTTLDINVADAGQNAFNDATNKARHTDNYYLGSAYNQQCGPTGATAHTNADLSLGDAATIAAETVSLYMNTLETTCTC